MSKKKFTSKQFYDDSMPKISVIVPVYGVEKYIDRCARSLFEQTINDLEIIFIDDCSPDQSMTILATTIEEYRLRIVEKNYRVRTDRMSTNSGIAAVRRYGIKLATGDYIIHCDSDDWVDVDLYEKLYLSAIQYNCELAVCDLQSHDGLHPINTIIGCKSTDVKEFISSLLYQNTPWSLCNKLFNRELYENYVTIFPVDNMGEDMAITMQLMCGVHKITYVKEVNYYYFSNPNSISKTPGIEAVLSRFNQYLNNFEIVNKRYEKEDFIKIYRKEFEWLKYSIKAILNLSDKKCCDIWKNTYPFVEYKILFYKKVTYARKKQALKYIIKHLTK